MRHIVLFFLIAGAMGIFAAPAKACDISGQRWQFGKSVSFGMNADTGERCEHETRLAGRSVMTGIRISRRPRHGTAYTDGATWGYKSAPGFKGHDAFVVSITGHYGTNAPGTTNIHVAVSVR